MQRYWSQPTFRTLHLFLFGGGGGAELGLLGRLRLLNSRDSLITLAHAPLISLPAKFNDTLLNNWEEITRAESPGLKSCFYVV